MDEADDVAARRDAIARGWDWAMRHPSAVVVDHADPRVIRLAGHRIAQVAIDERPDGRFARVSIGRADGGALDEAATGQLAAALFDAGGLGRFPVHRVAGADDATLHYVLDLEAFKAAQAMDHIARAVAITGAPMPAAPAAPAADTPRGREESVTRSFAPRGPAAQGGSQTATPFTLLDGTELGDAELAAIQFACPLPELARAAELPRLRAHDATALAYLSDHFRVPRAWIEFQVQFFLAELDDGYVDERGHPRAPS
jgi:hypothetical protein